MASALSGYPGFKPVIRMADIAAGRSEPAPDHPKFGASVQKLGLAVGAQMLGASMTTVDPGKRAFPFHAHRGNEEMFVILEGEGVYRFGDERHPVNAGDLCFAPKGGPETAHQLENSGTGPLRYLAISTMVEPEIAEYPDSGKFLALVRGPSRSFVNADYAAMARDADGKVGYWDGEV